MRILRALINLGLLLFLMALLGAPLGAFRYLKQAPQKLFSGATLSAVAKREYEGFFSVVTPSPAPQVKEAVFSVFSGKKVTYDDVLELTNETDLVTNYKVQILTNSLGEEANVKLYFAGSENQLEIALPPKGRAKLSLSAEGYFPSPETRTGVVTFVVF